MRTQAEIGKTDSQGFPGGSVAKNPPAKAGDAGRTGSIPGSGNPLEKKMATLQYSCLENAMDRGAWRAMVCGVAKRWTRLSTSRHAFASQRAPRTPAAPQPEERRRSSHGALRGPWPCPHVDFRLPTSRNARE